MNEFRLFFSHRTSEATRVKELRNSLGSLLPNFPFKDVSGEVPFEDTWQEKATDVLKSCDGLICCVGGDTYMSDPVDWEIREAHRLRKPLVVTTLSEECRLPAACDQLRIKAVAWDSTAVAHQIADLLIPRALFRKHDWSAGDPDSSLLWNQYELIVRSWESLIARRQTVNTLYISANSAVLAAVGLLISSNEKMGLTWAAAGIATITLLGTALSFNWRRTILSYGTLSKAKAKVVAAFEEYMPARLFDTEWQVLETHRYRSTTDMDSQAALFFVLLFLAMSLISLGVTLGQFI